MRTSIILHQTSEIMTRLVHRSYAGAAQALAEFPTPAPTAPTGKHQTLDGGTAMPVAYRYTNICRPPSTFTLPKCNWTLIERPWDERGFAGVAHLPRSSYQYGVFEVDRQLTTEELMSFELKRVD